MESDNNNNMSNVQQFIDTTSRLLSLERAEEIEQESLWKNTKNLKDLERAGVAITKLLISDMTTGLFGRCLLTFTSTRSTFIFPSSFTPRDIVEIYDSSHMNIGRAVIYRVKEKAMTVVMEEYVDKKEIINGGTFRMLKVANQVTYDRYKEGLSRLSHAFSSPSFTTSSTQQLLSLLYTSSATTTQQPSKAVSIPQWTPFNTGLNESQQLAITNALAANELHMILGPPGTGKTTTVVELIRQFVHFGLRVLACAPSNLAVDNIVERLGHTITPVKQHKNIDKQQQQSSSSSSSYTTSKGLQPRCIRIGHIARVHTNVLKYSLENSVKYCDNEKVCVGIREEISERMRKVDKSKDKNEKFQLRKEIRTLQNDLRVLEKRSVHEVLLHANVLCCTLTSTFSTHILQHAPFDVVVIDEAAQAMECACLLPILLSKSKLILAGDQFQLGPVLQSKEAEKQGLGRTLFERLYAVYGENITTMLIEQYRMHETIMNFSSHEFYQSKLIAPPHIRQHLLYQLPNVNKTENTMYPFIFIDTSGCDMEEDEGSGGNTNNAQDILLQDSKSNMHEVQLVKIHVDSLVSAGVDMKYIGVITPYNAQCALLKEALIDTYPHIEIGSVDAFQGREKEVIIISTVRSNANHDIGFLSEIRRMNVAITRARRQVTMIGDSATLSTHPFLARLIEYAAQYGEYRSADNTHTIVMDYSEMKQTIMTNQQANHVTTLANTILQQTSSSSSSSSTTSSTATSSSSNLSSSSTTSSTTSSSTITSTSTNSSSAPKQTNVTKQQTPTSTTSSLPSSISNSTPLSSTSYEHNDHDEWDESRILSIIQTIVSNASKSNIDDTQLQYQFPSTLNSFQRKLVHEICEQQADPALHHVSQGENQHRFIHVQYIRKQHTNHQNNVSTTTAASNNNNNNKPHQQTSTKQQQQKQQNVNPSHSTTRDHHSARQHALDAMELKAKGKISTPNTTSSNNTQQQQQQPPPPPSQIAITIPDTDDNISTHADPPSTSSTTPVSTMITSDTEILNKMRALNVQDNVDMETKEDEKYMTSPTTLPTLNDKKKMKRDAAPKEQAKLNSHVENNNDNEDIDSFLDELIHNNQSNQCHSNGCTVSVKVMGFTCEYCRERYCTKHMNPALHGCGAAHKSATLHNMKQQLKSTHQPPLKANDKIKLQERLEKKIAEAEKSRAKQQKKDGKK